MQNKLVTPLAVLLSSALCLAQEDSTVVQSSDSLYGTLSVQSALPVGIWLNEQAVGHTPFSMKLPLGWAIYSARSPGYWTESFLVNVKQGMDISQEIKLKEYGLPSREMPEISHISNLKELEYMYDSLSRIQPSATPDSVCIAHFVAEFPLPHSAPDTLTTGSPLYRKYYEVYSNERELSFNEFYYNCAGPVQQNLNAVLARMNELGKERLTGFVPVVEAEFVPVDASGLKGHLLLILRSPDSRANVAWVGTWENEFLTGENLIRALTAPEPIALAFLTAQNKTLWVPIDSGYSRHFYKYHNLNVSWNGLLLPMEGEFVLPDWLADLVPKDSLPQVVLQDTVKQDTAIINRAFLAQIPSGTFKYKGKNMSIKSFYINTTEISQSLYSSKCGAKNFDKYKGDSLPAHSVTWKEANSCCSAIGGDLPTEAEWEYAARAGIPNEYAFAGEAKNHAVFDGKKPVKIAGKKPNGWGLYDMFGNVSEWVKDDGFWFGKYKYLKGGSWKSGESNLKVESKEEEDTRYWGRHVGFRCVFRD